MAFLHKYNVKLHKVTPQAINLNVLLLFFVSLEPFLFNELNANFSVQYVSMIYALDLGGLFAVEAFLSNCVLTEINRPNELYCDFRHSRNMQTVAALFFFCLGYTFLLDAAGAAQRSRRCSREVYHVVYSVAPASYRTLLLKKTGGGICA